MFRGLGACFLWLALTGSVWADIKVGFIDFDRVAEEYHKSKTALEILIKEKERGEEALSKEFEEYAAWRDKLSELITLGAATTEKQAIDRSVQAFDLLMEGDEERRRLAKLKTDREKDFVKKYGLLTESILEDIKRSVGEICKERGFTVVVDSSATSESGPVILNPVKGSGADVTDELLARLNKNAPAPSTPASAPTGQ